MVRGELALLLGERLVLAEVFAVDEGEGEVGVALGVGRRVPQHQVDAEHAVVGAGERHRPPVVTVAKLETKK